MRARVAATDAAMNALRFTILFGSSIALTVACGSAADSGSDPATADPNPSGTGEDAGPVDGASSTPPTMTPSDAASEASADATNPDELTKPHPPAGATMCGGGAVTLGDFANTCAVPSMLLDFWQGGKFPRTCGAVTFASADYQVWCTADLAYVFVHYTSLRATGTITCKGGTTMLLGALWESGNGGGDTGINLKSGYRGAPNDMFDAQKPIDAYTWITVGRASKSARLYLTPSPQPIGQCGEQSAGFRSVVGGAAVTWQ